MARSDRNLNINRDITQEHNKNVERGTRVAEFPTLKRPGLSLVHLIF